MVVQSDELLNVSDLVSDLTHWWVLEATLWVLAPVVEDTSLLIDVVDLQWLKLTAFTELDILQSLDVDDQSVRLGLGNRLLDLQVSQLQHIGKARAALHQRLGHHAADVGGDHGVRKRSPGQVVQVLRDVRALPVSEHRFRAYHKASRVHTPHIHLVWLSIKDPVVLCLMLHALEVEANVSEPALLFLEVHRVDRDKLKVQDLHHVLIVTVDGSHEPVVVVRRVESGRVVVVLVLDFVCDLLVLLLCELITSQPLQLLDRDTLDVASIYDVAEVGVLRVAVYEVDWVHILQLNALVGVVASFDHSHAKGNQILDCPSECSVVEVCP